MQLLLIQRIRSDDGGQIVQKSSSLKNKNVLKYKISIPILVFILSAHYLGAEGLLGNGLRGMEEIFFAGQVDFLGSRDRALHAVAKATVVFAQVGSDWLGDGARRLEEQSGAIMQEQIIKLIIIQNLFVSKLCFLFTWPSCRKERRQGGTIGGSGNRAMR